MKRMDELLRELRYQGNNLNQLTVMARQGRITQVNYEPFYGGVPERMANIKFIAVSRSLSGILDYVTNREKTVERLISGVNCMAQTAQDELKR